MNFEIQSTFYNKLKKEELRKIKKHERGGRKTKILA